MSCTALSACSVYVANGFQLSRVHLAGGPVQVTFCAILDLHELDCLALVT
jgi:hypothetical protein